LGETVEHGEGWTKVSGVCIIISLHHVVCCVQIFLLSLGEEEAVSAVRQFCDLLSQKKQKQDRDLSFCDLLLLTVFAYSLAEGGQWKDVDDQQLRV
jgi:hypothetical protein